MNNKQTNDMQSNSFMLNSLISTSNKDCYKTKDYIEYTVSVHSVDRDVSKYPSANEFRIRLPEVLKNVVSVDLTNINLPTFYYNISETYQNNTFCFSIPPLFKDVIQLISIPSGDYNGVELANSLTDYLNKTTTQHLYAIGAYTGVGKVYTDFSVTFDSVSNKFTILNTKFRFRIFFNKRPIYQDSCNFDYFTLPEYWGLGFNLGFPKMDLISVYDEEQDFNYLKSPEISRLPIQNILYMSVKPFDYISQISPYTFSTTSTFNNDYSGLVNTAFAQIIISNTNNNYVPEGRYKRTLPHIEGKVSDLFISFRYHNRSPVDFNNQDINLTFKFKCLTDCKYTT